MKFREKALLDIKQDSKECHTQARLTCVPQHTGILEYWKQNICSKNLLVPIKKNVILI